MCFFWWGTFSHQWVCKQTRYVSLEWNKPQRSSQETSVFGLHHCVVLHITSRHHWSLLFSGYQLCHNYEHWTVLVYDTRLFSANSFGNGIRGYMVPTGWCYCTCSKGYHELFEANVSWTAYLFEGWCDLASMLTRFSPMRFFPSGLPEVLGVYQPPQHLGRPKEQCWS
jgi:hypothetical protein